MQDEGEKVLFAPLSNMELSIWFIPCKMKHRDVASQFSLGGDSHGVNNRS